MSSDSFDLPDYFRNTQELKESFWPEIEPNIPMFQHIISSHFGVSCGELSLLDEGAYARIYETSLTTGQKLAVRVLLPVRDGVKTEAEVATMDFVRAKTTIPVPKVHLFCSTRDNPVGAEWIVMDFVAGERFLDCWEDLPLEAKRRTAEDLSSIMASLFSFTSTHCGSLLSCLSLTDDQRARRFGDPPCVSHTVDVHTSFGELTLGPVNDFAFTEPLFPAPLDSCGPFASEREFLEAVAYGNIAEKDDRVVALRRWPYEKVFEVYDRVRNEYAKDVESNFGEGAALFHLSHGDLSDTNIMLDNTTGRVVGVIDWEVSGFRPSWLAAGRGGALEDHPHDDEDECGEDDSDGCFCLRRTFYEDPFPVDWTESEDDSKLRKYFLTQLYKRNSELAAHHVYGSELRAIFEAFRETVAANVATWVEMYHERRWNVSKRGPFLFDLNQWIRDRYDLWKRLHDEGACA